MSVSPLSEEFWVAKLKHVCVWGLAIPLVVGQTLGRRKKMKLRFQWALHPLPTQTLSDVCRYCTSHTPPRPTLSRNWFQGSHQASCWCNVLWMHPVLWACIKLSLEVRIIQCNRVLECWSCKGPEGIIPELSYYERKKQTSVGHVVPLWIESRCRIPVGELPTLTYCSILHHS